MTAPQNTSSTDILMQVVLRNRNLGIETETLKKKIDGIEIEKQTLQTEIYKLNDDLKMKEGELNTNREDKYLLQERCKTLESENLRLKVEIIKEAEAKINIENDLERKEEELRSLQEKNTKSNSNLSPYVSNEVILKVIDMHDNLQRLNAEISEITAALTKEITENRYDYEEELENYTMQYEKHKENLEKCDVMLTNNTFPMMVGRFENLRRDNTRKQKEIFKKIYNLGKGEDKLDIMQSYISKSSTDFKSYIDDREKILNDLKEVSFLNDFKIEKEMFKDLTKTCKDEILHFIKLCRASAQGTSNTSHSSVDTDEPIMSNLRAKPNSLTTHTSESKSVDNSLNKDLCESDENAIMMYNLPESDTAEDDLLKIKAFLSKFNVKEVGNVSRFGRKGDVEVRPVKVVLQDEETVRHIAEKSKETRTPVRIKKFYNDYNDFRKKRLEQIFEKKL